jgi:AcrR family transcriptional regulator
MRSYEAIMDATIDLLTEVGYHRLTIEAVASRAGVGKTTVYRWWPTKIGLAVEALSSRMEMTPVQTTGDLRVDVRALIHSAVHIFTKSDLGRALPEMASDLDEDHDARAKLIEWLGPARAGNMSILFSAAARSELPYDLDAGLLLDMICGTVLYRKILGRRASAAMVDQLTNMIVDHHYPRTAISSSNTPTPPSPPDQVAGQRLDQ